MKKKKFIYGLALVIGLSFTAFANADQASAADMHRLYNKNSGEHFYTANNNEKSHLVKVGWKYEGLGWTAPASGTPVYRLYNANAGDHHYTLNANEKNNLVKVGWKYEGIGWYSDTKKAVPLYRAYNPNAKAGSHNYTTNYAEQKNLLRVGWKNEGIAWYGIKKTTTPAPKPPAVQKYTIKVEHKGSDGKVLKSSSVSVEKGKKYTAKSENFNGYTLKGSSSQTITVSKNQTITFIYTKNPAPVTKFKVSIWSKIENGKYLSATPVVVEVEKGKNYTATARTFDGYTLVGDKTQTVTVNSDKTIIFNYRENKPSKVDKTALINYYNELIKNTVLADYSHDSIVKFNQGTSNIKVNIIDKDTATQSQVDQALTSLKNLKSQMVNIKNLKTKVDAVKSTAKDNYTDVSWNTFQTALTEAQTVLADKRLNLPTQSQVDSALTKLTNAHAALKIKEENLDTVANQIALDAFKIINDFRQSEHPNLKPLKHNTLIQRGSNIRAKEVLEYFEHARPNGGTYDEPIYDAGYAGYLISENIGKFSSTEYTLDFLKKDGPKYLVELWKQSTAGHRGTLLSGESNEAAVGIHIKKSGNGYHMGFVFINGDDGYSPQSGHKIYMVGYDENGKALYQRTIRTLNDTYTPSPEQSILDQGYVPKSGFDTINLPKGSDGRKSIEVKLVYKKK